MGKKLTDHRCVIFKLCWMKPLTFTASIKGLHGAELHAVSHAVLYHECISYCCFSVAKLCLTLWNPMDCSTPGFPELHPLAEFAPTHVH